MSSTESKTGRAIYFRLLSYVKPYRGMLILGLCLSAVAALMEPLLPAMMKPLLDNGFVRTPESEPSMLQSSPWIAPLAVIGLMTFRGLVTFCAGYAMSWVQTRLINDLRRAMFDHLIHLPLSYFQDHNTSREISRVTNDVNSIGAAATTAGVTVVRESLSIVGLLAWLFYLNWTLTVFILLVVPVIAWVTKVISRRLRLLSRSSHLGMGEMLHCLQEVVGGQKVTKIFGAEHQEIQRFELVNNALMRFTMKSTVAAASGTPITHFFISLAIGGVVFIALLQASSGSTSVGSFVSYITAMLMLLAPIRQLSNVNQPLQQGLAAAESVFDLLDTAVEQETGAYCPEQVRGEIRLEKVSFGYPSTQTTVISDLDLIVHPGETVAFVGPSGSGKSTLMGLFPRFYTPDSGRVLLDGIELREYQLKALRAQIASVTQDTILFDDTVAANITYGSNKTVSEEALRAVASAANALEFIQELPDGFNSRIGENGSRLSGGQRQRLAIARAIWKDAPILILDEATASLDNASERLVQDALERLMQGKTTLVVAHRLSTIERADKIVVMQEGRIVEIGTHAELLARQGMYWRLHAVQRGVEQEAR